MYLHKFLGTAEEIVQPHIVTMYPVNEDEQLPMAAEERDY